MRPGFLACTDQEDSFLKGCIKGWAREIINCHKSVKHIKGIWITLRE